MEGKEKKENKKDYTSLNIFQKMSLATSKIEKVVKGLTVGEGKNSYKAVSDKDVLNAVKPVEVELGIYSYPVKRTILRDERLEFQNKYGTTINFVTRLEIIYRFVNVDNPEEFIDITTYGDGIDSQDKAMGKAMTYGDKYGLLKAYKIETGDDPDQQKSEESFVELTEEVAKAYKLNFGKHKGKTLGELLESDYDYLEWLRDGERTDDYIKNCLELIMEKELSEEEQELILIYMNKVNKLVHETNTDFEELLKYFKVKSTSNMTLNQLKEAVAILEKKKQKNKEEVF